MTERICSVDGCGRVHVARGWCSMHWRRWRKDGDPGEASPRTQPRAGICSVDGCGRKHEARGLCNMHYKRLSDTGLVGQVEPIHERDHPDVCTVDGCDREYHIRGLCNMHYQRLAKSGSVGDAAPRVVRDHPDVCSVSGCERQYRTFGLCDMHYARLRNTGSTGSPLGKPRFSCGVCAHPEVEEIDARLRRGEGGFGPDYGVTGNQIYRHKYKHLDNEQYHARAAAEAVKILNEAKAAVRA